MELDRNEIERTDFAQARRGYNPDEVDRHLAEIAEAVEELKAAQSSAPASSPRASGTPSLAGAAAEQVRTIVEAAERSAAEIESSALSESERVTSEAKR
nr:DivIVA domain-containing protein [Thermoleophilaceae bacterium]